MPVWSCDADGAPGRARHTEMKLVVNDETVTVEAITGRDRWIAAAIVAVLLLAYNANGREIGSYDSQPTKFAARELLLKGTLTLNHVVGATPAYAERMAFVLARQRTLPIRVSPGAGHRRRRHRVSARGSWRLLDLGIAAGTWQDRGRRGHPS